MAGDPPVAWLRRCVRAVGLDPGRAAPLDAGVCRGIQGLGNYSSLKRDETIAKRDCGHGWTAVVHAPRARPGVLGS